VQDRLTAAHESRVISAQNPDLMAALGKWLERSEPDARFDPHIAAIRA
jgi:hypothetical protein